jgi:hypothetical protein
VLHFNYYLFELADLGPERRLYLEHKLEPGTVISCIIRGLGRKEIQPCGILMQYDRANNNLQLQAHNPQKIMC